MSEQRSQNPLEIGYQLQRYQIERVLGENVHGVTYLARDLNLDRAVAIKEYLPADLAMRDGPVFVNPIRDDLDERYHAGLELFLAEARVLAKIDHPNIVRVLNVFVNHNTAYMVMLFEDGTPLSEVFKNQRTLPEPELLDIVLPILDGLERVHKTGYIHGDIRPSNILIRHDASPVLLNFGFARPLVAGSGTDTESAYLALEQYYENGDQQGPWTDIYGLAATVYRGLAGSAPAGALQRSQAALHGASDPVVAALQLGGDVYGTAFLKAIDHALSLNHGKRPQSIAAWRRALSGGRPSAPAQSPAPEVPAEAPETVDFSMPSDSDTTVSPRLPKAAKEQSFVLPLLFGIGLGLAGIAYYAYYETTSDDEVLENEPVVNQISPIPAPNEVEATATAAPQLVEAPTSPAAVEQPAATGTGSGTTTAERVAELMKEAQSAFDAGELVDPPERSALDKYRAVLALVPGDLEALSGLQKIAERLVGMARDNANQGQLDEATKLLDKAADIRPGLPAADAFRVELASRRRDLEKRDEQRVEEDARRMQRDQSVDRLVQEARRAMRRFQWAKAEAALTKATELAPTAEDVKDLRDQLNLRRAQASLAITAPPRGAEEASTESKVQTLLAAARREIDRHQWDQAQLDIDRASQLAPDSDDALSLQVELMGKREEKAKAADSEAADQIASKPTPAVPTVVPTRRTVASVSAKEPGESVAPPHDIAPKQTAPKEIAPKEIASRETAPRETASRETASRETAPRETAPRETASRETAPRETAPRETAPREIAPREIAPEDQVADVRPGRSSSPIKRDVVPPREVQARPVAPEPESSGGAVVQIQTATASQESVSPGDTIRFTTEYLLQLPPGERKELVEVRWALRRDGRRLGQEGADTKLAVVGTNVATNDFTLPAYMKPGRYTVEHRVRVNGRTVSARTSFTVVPRASTIE